MSMIIHHGTWATFIKGGLHSENSLENINLETAPVGFNYCGESYKRDWVISMDYR